ncbi:MAG TPA: CxxxxCH/CxxCH domain-containing protein [Geobacter sp.]|nr:CxxxxCH/CxxCH domain-containing protein [Geobacter sp.]
MKKIAIYAAAAFMILMLDHVQVHAVPAPHDSQCLQCHVSHNKLGTQTDDLVCLSCHNPSGGAKAQNMPFSPGDAANPYGAASGLQNSHNWVGSDTNPKAGALPPLDPAVALKQHEGKISCAKCHNLHGPKQSETNSAPFLRALNDADQMCLDCHRQRNTQNHLSGSHPVLVSYSGAVKRNPEGFYATPRSANPANPTAAMKLVKGTVSCSTCHGVHYTDSNSATLDNRSSALLGRLTASAGNLLRAESRGGRANDVNLCTSCHQGMSAHNAGGQNVQCVDCHGGHVAETDGSDPNVYLVRRFMRYSTYRGKFDLRALNRPAYFLSAVNKNYKDGNGTGLCQACHITPPDNPDCNAPDAVCNDCHAHNNATGAFSPNTSECTSCHGNPPTENLVGSPNGYAEGYIGVDESRSGHAPHAERDGYNFDCDECHKGSQHASGQFQQVFTSSADTLAGSFGAAPHYDTAARTCATVYCHSNGAPRGGTIKFSAPPPFANAQGAIIGKPFECGVCHGAAVAGFNNLSTNAHFRHVSLDTGSGLQYGCSLCHASVASGNGTILDRRKHVNGVKELSFTGLAAGTSSNGATCSTSYCHSNGKGAFVTVSWSDRQAGACGSCHGTLPSVGGGLIATGAHFAHFSTSSQSGAMLTQSGIASCQLCHGGYLQELGGSHVNGSIDVTTPGYSPAGTGTCTPCHKQTVNWAGGAVSCESCHTAPLSVVNGSTAQDMSLAATKGHGKSGLSCLSCHARSERHFNGNSRLQPVLIGEGNASCRYCHDSQARVPNERFRNMSTHTLVKGGAGTMGCSVCHDAHGTGNLAQIRDVINGQPIVYTDQSTGLIDPVTNRGLCQACHTTTLYYKAGVPETHHPTKDCLTCHRHNAAGNAFKPVLVCDGCHGYPPAPRKSATAVAFGTLNNWSSARFEDYSGGGGAHLVAAHVSPNAKPSEGWVNCTMCHNAGRLDGAPNHRMAWHISDITVDVDPKYRFDNGFTVYTGAKLVDPPQANVTGSCFNISCHMSPSPRWSTER